MSEGDNGPRKIYSSGDIAAMLRGEAPFPEGGIKDFYGTVSSASILDAFRSFHSGPIPIKEGIRLDNMFENAIISSREYNIFQAAKDGDPIAKEFIRQGPIDWQRIEENEPSDD